MVNRTGGRMMRFGIHVPMAGGARGIVAAAVERGCDAIQIFSSSPRAWALPINSGSTDLQLRQLLNGESIGPVLLHAPYLANIGSPDPDTYARSVASLVSAADRARRLDGHVVVHAGHAVTGERVAALERAAAAVRTALHLCSGASVLVEPTAGGKGSVAATLAQTAELLEAIGDVRAGVCIDTCHLHAAGHDLSSPAKVRRALDEADRLFGTDRIVAVHLNDSMYPAGSCRDRHEQLGAGTIGEPGLAALLRDVRLSRCVVICETPGSPDDDRDNVARARRMATRGRRP